MYTRKWTVRFGDVDMFQIGFYPRIVSELRNTSDMFMESIGQPFWKLIDEQDIGLPIVEAGIEFVSPVTVGDIIKIQLQPELGETSLRFEFEGKHEDGSLAFTAFEQRVCLPVHGDETVPLPTVVTTAIEER